MVLKDPLSGVAESCGSQGPSRPTGPVLEARGRGRGQEEGKERDSSLDRKVKGVFERVMCLQAGGKDKKCSAGRGNKKEKE